MAYSLVEYLERDAQPRLRYAVMWPSVSAHAAVLITPGYLEHIGRYERVAELWASLGFAVCVHDPRGQGLSEGRRGHVDAFDDYVRDACAVLDAVGKQPQWRALGAPIIVGHSMGGLISLHMALAARVPLRGLGPLSPFLGLALPAPAWKVWFARRVSQIYPTYQERSGVHTHLLTHDPERIRMIDADPLSKERVVTARWFTEMERAQAEMRTQIESLSLPVLCLAAGDDHIADVNVTREAFKRLAARNPRAELRVKEGQFHELHQELHWRDHMLELAHRFREW